MPTSPSTSTTSRPTASCAFSLGSRPNARRLTGTNTSFVSTAESQLSVPSAALVAAAKMAATTSPSTPWGSTAIAIVTKAASEGSLRSGHMARRSGKSTRAPITGMIHRRGVTRLKPPARSAIFFVSRSSGTEK